MRKTEDFSVMFLCQEPNLEESFLQGLAVCHGSKTIRQAARVGGRHVLDGEHSRSEEATAGFCALHHMPLADSCSTEATWRLQAWHPHLGAHLFLPIFLQPGGEVLWTCSTNKGWKLVDKCSSLPSFGETILRAFYLFPQRFSSKTEPWLPRATNSSITHLLLPFPSSQFCTISWNHFLSK